MAPRLWYWHPLSLPKHAIAFNIILDKKRRKYCSEKPFSLEFWTKITTSREILILCYGTYFNGELSNYAQQTSESRCSKPATTDLDFFFTTGKKHTSFLVKESQRVSFLKPTHETLEVLKSSQNWVKII